MPGAVHRSIHSPGSYKPDQSAERRLDRGKGIAAK